MVDLQTDTIEAIHGLGFKNWSVSSLDPNDKDGVYDFSTFDNYNILIHFLFKSGNQHFLLFPQVFYFIKDKFNVLQMEKARILSSAKRLTMHQHTFIFHRLTGIKTIHQHTCIFLCLTGINLNPWPVYGMYQPDSIKVYTHKNVDYILTANEGDSKDYDTFSEERRVEDEILSANFGKG